MKNAMYYVIPKPLYLLTILLFFSCSSSKFLKEIKTFRAQYKQDFNTNPHAPLKGSQLDSMRFFTIDKTFRFIADVQLLQDGEIIQVPTSSGSLKSFKEYAILTFQDKQNIQHSLSLYQSQQTLNIPQYKDYLFLPFNDNTNGITTYGGGRYIDIMIQEIQDNKLVLDFNKSYNPYCHYSAGYNCPIPPPNNYLDMEINAGEKLWIGTYINETSH